MHDNFVCIIPARAGSKGIPDKNMQLLDGWPLWMWSLIAAQESNIPNSNIVVSSDHPKILKTATEMGVIARHRPVHLCADLSSTESAMLDVLDYFPNKWKHIILLQPTSPLRTQELIERCIIKYLEGYDSLLTATKFYKFFWAKNDDRWQATYDPQNRPMRQLLGDNDYFYFDNGSVYITDINVLRSKTCRVGDNPCIYETTTIEGLQIDDLDDLEIVRGVISTNLRDKFHCRQFRMSFSEWEKVSETVYTRC